MNKRYSEEEIDEQINEAIHVLVIGNQLNCGFVLLNLRKLGKRAIDTVPFIIDFLHSNKSKGLRGDCLSTLLAIRGDKADNVIKEYLMENEVNFIFKRILEFKDKSFYNLYIHYYLNSKEFAGSPEVADILFSIDKNAAIKLFNKILSNDKFEYLKDTKNNYHGFNEKRMNVIRKLAEVNHKLALPYIKSILVSEGKNQRIKKALDILITMPNKKMLFPDLIKILADPKRKETYYQELFLEYLLDIGDEDAIEYITKYVEENKLDGRLLHKISMKVIEYERKTSKLKPLIISLYKENKLDKLLNCLGRIGGENVLLFLSDKLKEGAYFSIDGIDKELKNQLLAKVLNLIRISNVFKYNLKHFIKQFDVNDVAHSLIEIIKTHQDIKHRIDILDYLIKQNPLIILDVCDYLLVNEENLQMIHSIVFKLSYIRTSDSYAILKKHFKHPSPTVREYINSPKLPYGLTKEVYQILEYYKYESDPELRKKSQLKYMSPKQAKKIVIAKFKENRNQTFDEIEINVLINNLNESIIEFLLTIFLNIEDSDLQIKFLEKLRDEKYKKYKNKLLTFLESNLNEDVKINLNFTLASLGSKQVVPYLFQEFEKYKKYEEREQSLLPDFVKSLLAIGEKEKLKSFLLKVKKDNITKEYFDEFSGEYKMGYNLYYEWAHENLLEIDKIYAIEYYLTEVDDGEFRERKLDQYADSFNFEEYLEFIKKNRYYEVKKWAIEIITKKFPKKKVVPELLKILKNKSLKYLDTIIFDSFRKLKPKNVLEKLIVLFLKENKYEKIPIIFNTAITIDENETMNLLIDKFDSTKRSKQKRIIRFLGNIKNAKFFLEFIENSDFDDDLKEEAYWSLQKIEGKDSLIEYIDEMKYKNNLSKINLKKITDFKNYKKRLIPNLIAIVNDNMKLYLEDYYEIPTYVEFGNFSREGEDKLNLYDAIYEAIDIIIQDDLEEGISLYFEARKIENYENLHSGWDKLGESIKKIDKKELIFILYRALDNKEEYAHFDKNFILDIITWHVGLDDYILDLLIELESSGKINVNDIKKTTQRYKSKKLNDYLQKKLTDDRD